MTDVAAVSDADHGLAPSRHSDPITESLSAYSKAFEDAQKVRIAATLRGDEWGADLFHGVEHQFGLRLQKQLKQHPLWPWLSQFNGLKGPRVARLIAIIGDPMRFPGQKCSMGHTLPPVFEVGQPCPVTAVTKTETDDGLGGDDLSPDAEIRTESERRTGVGGPFVTAERLRESDSRLGGDDLSPDAEHGAESDAVAGVGGPFVTAVKSSETEKAPGGDDLSPDADVTIAAENSRGVGGPFVTADPSRESEEGPGGDDLSPDTEPGHEFERNVGVGGPFVTAESRIETDGKSGGDDLSSSPDEVRAESDSPRVRGTFPTGATDSDRESDVCVGCVGRMLPPRSGTGVASLWHYLGLHVRDGKLPMRRKGQQADWHITARSLILGPQGVSSQIVMQRPVKYRDLYDTTKARIAERSPEWRPIQVEKVARIVASKAFLGDLLVEWKRIIGEADPCRATVDVYGLSDDSQEEAS